MKAKMLKRIRRIVVVGLAFVGLYFFAVCANISELHKAVISKDAKLAAYLLRQGADFTLKDQSLKNAFEYASLDFLHDIRNEYVRTSDLSFKQKEAPSFEWENLLSELNERDIIKISNFFTKEELNKFCLEFEVMISHIKAKSEVEKFKGNGFTEEYYNKEDDLFISNNPFKRIPSFARLCIDKRIMWMVNNYFQAQGYLEQVAAIRLLPGGKAGEGSWQWHHDAWGKRVHVMVLLTDVDNEGQAMTYVVGSNKVKHSYEKFANSRVNLDYAKEMLGENIEIFKAVGKAGDIFIFDSNGIHSGNRTKGKVRDTVLAMYSRNRSYIWDLYIPEEIVKNVENKYDIKPFERILDVSKKDPIRGLFPKYKSWVESLPHVHSWV